MSLRTTSAYLVIVVAITIGGLSLLLFGAFVFGRSFTVTDLGWGETALLAWDSLLCLLFFVQHSTMIRSSVRDRLAAIVPRHFHGAFYTVASGAVLLVLVLFWQDSATMLFSLQGPLRWAANGLFLLSLMGMIWSLYALGSFDMLGVRQILAQLQSSPIESVSLRIRGPYRWVRHPLYFLVLVLIWFRPDLSVDRLLFNVLFSAWIILGTFLEERDLVAEFGEVYVRYQRSVPMLIPWRLSRP